MRREYRDRASGNRIKWFINYFLLFVLSVTVLFQGLELWSGNKPSEWGKHEEQAAETVGGMVISPDEGNGVSLTSTEIPHEAFEDYGIMTIAESAKQVKATVTPAGAEDAVLDWSIVFKDPASSWASGKQLSDYVTITPTSDGALTANVTCKQAFGEQVIITAAIRGNASVKGTGTVDYQQKCTFIGMYLSSSSGTRRANWELTSDSSQSPQSCTVPFPGQNCTTFSEFYDYFSQSGSKFRTSDASIFYELSSTYTIKATLGRVHVYIAYDKSSADVISQFGGKILGESRVEYEVFSQFEMPDGDYSIGSCFDFDFFKLLRFDKDACDSMDWIGYKRFMKETFKSNLVMNITAKGSVNGADYSTTYQIHFDTDTYGTFASDVEMDKVVF